MDIHFCRYYTGDGYPPSNRYCRTCPRAAEACDVLWQKVVDLSYSQNGNPVFLPGTRAVLYPNHNNRDFVHLRVNSQWNLSKEDFLHFISTGRARMGRKGQRQDPEASPSMTRQEPYVQSIVEVLGGEGIKEIKNVRNVQGKTR